MNIQNTGEAIKKLRSNNIIVTKYNMRDEFEFVFYNQERVVGFWNLLTKKLTW